MIFNLKYNNNQLHTLCRLPPWPSFFRIGGPFEKKRIGEATLQKKLHRNAAPPANSHRIATPSKNSQNHFLLNITSFPIKNKKILFLKIIK